MKNKQQMFETAKIKADRYYDAYKPQMEMLEKSMLSKVRAIDAFDVCALGKQLEAFESYKQMLEYNNSASDLGMLPNIALNVISATFAATVLPIIASVQPIEEQQGLVYFHTVQTQTTKGTATAGNTVTDPRTGIITDTGFAGSRVEATAQDVTVAGTLAYSFNLAGAPVSSQTLEITVDGLTTLIARDVGPQGADKNIGAIWGAGLSGTINYTTGQVDVTFAADPGNGHNILASYAVNYEKASTLPTIGEYYDAKPVKADVMAVQSNFGMLQSFALNKRFGIDQESKTAENLVQAMNREIVGSLVKKLYVASLTVSNNSTTFYSIPSAGVSKFDQRQTFKFKLADAGAKLLGNCGRGQISVMIVGYKLAAVVETLPGFVKISDGNALGIHLFGTLDGVPVVRVPETNVLDAKTGLCMWKGMLPFEAAGVYAPYMPLILTDTLPLANNPLAKMRAAATWAATEVMVPQFVTRMLLNDADVDPGT